MIISPLALALSSRIQSTLSNCHIVSIHVLAKSGLVIEMCKRIGSFDLPQLDPEVILGSHDSQARWSAGCGGSLLEGGKEQK